MKINNKQKNNLDGWQNVKLADIGDFSKGAGILKDQLVDDGYNAVRYGELYTRYNFQIKKIYSHIPSSIISTTKKIKYGDILFAGSGETIDEIGKSAAYLLNEECYAGGDIVIFSPKNADSLFLSYFLNGDEARKKLRELGQGQSVVHIYKSDLKNMKLYLPPISKQKHIVVVLETWDQAIDKLTRKIEIKKNIKKGLMQNLLTGKIRLTGFDDGWKKVKLRDVCGIKTGKKDVNEGNPNGKYPFFTCAKRHTYSDKYSFDTEAILIAGNGEVGNCHYFNGKFEAYQRTYILDNFKNIEAFYLFLYLKHFFQDFIMSQKQMGAMPYIKFEMLADFEIKLPSEVKEQNAISNILSNADNEIEALKKKLSILNDQKKYLLNNLITGKIRTPENMSVK